jgi:hypothetical protein
MEVIRSMLECFPFIKITVSIILIQVQNELNKEKRSRIELEKILEETISSASHFEADLTACKIRERVMQRQLARYSSASRTPASSGATAMRRHGRRARYDLDSSGFGLRPPANGAYTDGD